MGGGARGQRRWVVVLSNLFPSRRVLFASLLLTLATGCSGGDEDPCVSVGTVEVKRLSTLTSATTAIPVAWCVDDACKTAAVDVGAAALTVGGDTVSVRDGDLWISFGVVPRPPSGTFRLRVEVAGKTFQGEVKVAVTGPSDANPDGCVWFGPVIFNA